MERMLASTVISPNVLVVNLPPALAPEEPSVSPYRSFFPAVPASLATPKLTQLRVLLKPVLQAEFWEGALSLKRKSNQARP